MPGISILKSNFSQSENSVSDNEHVQDEILSCALDTVMHDDRYIQNILLRKKSFWVACTKYPEYPISIHEDEHFWVCVEGKIYGQADTDIKREINALLIEVSKSGERIEQRGGVNRWLSITDGEFVIYALNKESNEFFIINDILGRLPLYYYGDDMRLIISRELSFVSYLLWNDIDIRNIENKENKFLFDRMAIAQYLLFGYPLDKRTLISDIYRMQPGTLGRISNGKCDKFEDGIPSGTCFNIENLYSFDVGQKKYADDSLKDNTDNLVSLFCDACKNRTNPLGKNVISLSGGFDSRLVAACIYRDKIACQGITYLEPGWKPLLGKRSEADIAKKVSDIFGLDWKDFGPIRANAQDFITLLRIKLGSIHLGYSFMLPLLKSLNKEFFSDAIFLTGYGGGRVFVNLLPPKKNGNMDELVHSIMNNEGFLSLSDVSTLVQISEDEIIDELKRVLTTYPEKELDQKYVHFIIYGGSFKAIFEVEDRDRLYLWSTSPFYSIPVFNYVMNCSDVNKSSRALHREMLRTLSPSATAVDNSDYGCSIVSYKFRVIVPFLKSMIFRYPILKRMAARIVRNKNSDVLDGRMISCVKDQMKNCEYLLRYFSRAKLDDMAINPAKYGLHAVYHLFTIISLIEQIYSKNSTIGKYYD